MWLDGCSLWGAIVDINANFKKRLSNYYANICLLRSVGHRCGGRESYLILIAPNILALVLNSWRSVSSPIVPDLRVNVSLRKKKEKGLNVIVHGLSVSISKLTFLPMCGFTVQLVEYRTGVTEVTGSNPIEALTFIRLLPSSCFNWKIYCDDHSPLSSTTAAQKYEFPIYFTLNAYSEMKTITYLSGCLEDSDLETSDLRPRKLRPFEKWLRFLRQIYVNDNCRD